MYAVVCHDCCPQTDIPAHLLEAVLAALEVGLRGCSPGEQQSLLEELAGDMAGGGEGAAEFSSMPVASMGINDLLDGFPEEIVARDWADIIRITRYRAELARANVGGDGGSAGPTTGACPSHVWTPYLPLDDASSAKQVPPVGHPCPVPVNNKWA